MPTHAPDPTAATQPQVHPTPRPSGRNALWLACALATLSMPSAAAPWDSAANQVLAVFTGGLTRTMAIIAVIACGIAAIAGRLSWDWAIKIIVGIVLIFGASAIVDYVIAAAS